MNVVSDCLLTEALLIGHRSCIGSVYSTYGLRERTNCGRGCSFSFFSCRNYYRDKEALRQMKQKKTCGKNQHVRIDNIYRKANLICCRTDDAVEINLRYYTEHDYITMPYQEKGVSKVSLRLEKYDCGSIYFESNNNGEIWHYVGVSGDYL